MFSIIRCAFRSKLVLLGLLVSFLIVGCLPETGLVDQAPTEVATDTDNQDQELAHPENVTVRRAQPVRNPIDVEEIPLPNCGGTGTLTQSLGTQTSVLRGVTIGAKARVSGGGEVEVPEVAKIYLEVEIEAAYEEEYQRANARLDSITMQAAPNTHVIYDIVWEQLSYTSIVNYSLGGIFQESDYTFLLQVPKVFDSREVDCDLEMPAPTIEVPEDNLPADQSEPEIPPQEEPPEHEIQPTQPEGQQNPGAISANTVDQLLGSGNWHCIDGFPNGVAIDNVPQGYVVGAPVIRVDKLGEFYYPGFEVPGGGLATVWFQTTISGIDCTSIMANVTHSDIDELLGQNNWYCLPEYPTGVKVINVPNGFVVKQPITSVDKLDQRYYKNEIVPGGGEATVWFSNNVYPNECP